MIPKESASPEIIEVRRKLEELPVKLDEARKKHIEKRMEYLIKKAEYENKFDAITLTKKAESEKRTQTDLKSLARQGSHQERLDMIRAEAEMRLADNLVRFLTDQLESAIEDSRNLRQEMRQLSGNQG